MNLNYSFMMSGNSYVRYQGIGTQTPIFISVANVRVIPGMTILWAGSILVVIGIVPLLFWGKRTES